MDTRISNILARGGLLNGLPLGGCSRGERGMRLAKPNSGSGDRAGVDAGGVRERRVQCQR